MYVPSSSTTKSNLNIPSSHLKSLTETLLVAPTEPTQFLEMLGAPPAFESRALRISNGDMDGSPKVGKRKGGGLRSLSHDERQRFFTASCVCAWFLLNMTIANLNKWIFHQYAFHQPALLTFLHMAACWVLGRAAMAFCFKPTLAARHPSAHVRRSIRSLSVVFVVSVASSNAALKYIHVSFSQSIGATAPMWTVLLSVLITGKAYPLRVYGALLMVSLGMLLCTTGEVNFHPLGFALVLVGVVTRALKSIVQGLLLSSADERLDSISLLYHMSKPSMALLAAWVLLVERDALWEPRLRSAPLWACIGASAAVAFFLNVANFLVTQRTSAVTLQVLGNIKVVMLIVISVAIFRNEVSNQAALGSAVSLFGVFLYNRAKEATRAPQQASSGSPV